MCVCFCFCILQWVLQWRRADDHDRRIILPTVNSVMIGALIICTLANWLQKRWNLPWSVRSAICCGCIITFLATPYVFYVGASCQSGPYRMAKIIPYAKLIGPVELGVTYVTLVSLQTEFHYKAVAAIIYMLVFRLGVRAALCPEFFFAGDWQGTSQLFLGVVAALFGLYKREIRSKASFIKGNYGEFGSRDSVLASSDRRPSQSIRERLMGYLRFVLQHYRGEHAPKELGFRRYYSRVSLNEQRVSYVMAVVSALFGAASLIIRHSISWPYGWTLVGLGIVIPVTSVLAIGFTCVPWLGDSHPFRQQTASTIMYGLVEGMSLVLVLRSMSQLPDSLEAFPPGPEIDSYLATIAFHINFSIARSSSDNVRGGFALICALLDLVMGVVIFMKAKSYISTALLVVLGSLAVTVGCAVAPWAEKNQRRFYRLVEVRRKQKTKPSLNEFDNMPKKRGTDAGSSQHAVGAAMSGHTMPAQSKTRTKSPGREILLRSAVIDERPSVPTSPATEVTLERRPLSGAKLDIGL
ncbi:hypothetical protein BC832DRAFT_219444 [Gaertneriomyces semiglobifer]|nr:hypothetical protein BC832DRAFT_219444 [Gaertneriomyces semiglobifer]